MRRLLLIILACMFISACSAAPRPAAGTAQPSGTQPSAGVAQPATAQPPTAATVSETKRGPELISVANATRLGTARETTIEAEDAINDYQTIQQGAAIVYRVGETDLRMFDWASGESRTMLALPEKSGLFDWTLGPTGAVVMSGCGEANNRGECLESQILLAEPGKKPSTLITLRGSVYHLSFSPGGRYLMAGDDRDGTYIIELPGGKVVYDPYADNLGSLLRLPDLSMITISPNDRYAAIRGSYSGVVNVIDLTTLEQIAKLNLKDAYPRNLTFNADGSRLAYTEFCANACKEERIAIWDFATQSQVAVRVIKEGLPGSVSMSFSPDGSVLALQGCSLDGCARQALVLLDATTLKDLVRLDSFNSLIQGMDFSADGTTITTMHDALCRTTLVKRTCTLDVKRWQIGDTVTATPVARTENGGYDRTQAEPLATEAIVTGELTAGQVKLYRLNAEPGDVPYVMLVAPNFAPYLELVGPNGKTLSTNDGMSSLQKLRPSTAVYRTVEQAGEYLVAVRADPVNGPDGSGAFKVQLINLRPIPLSYGQTVKRTVLYNAPNIGYTIEGQQGDVVTIVLSAPDNTTRLELFDPNGKRIGRTSGLVNMTPTSRLEAIELPKTGTYTLQMFLGRDSEQGLSEVNYTLTLEKTR
ncbi:MAG: hypothetical protein OHK0022_19300 [Roseiflexaceae bacterium]